MAIQLRQQMAAMQLREYHNEQVGQHVVWLGGVLCACAGVTRSAVHWQRMAAMQLRRGRSQQVGCGRLASPVGLFRV
jgi:hypothetical protein